MQFSLFFFFNDTATTEIYTLSLHDALPISTCLFKTNGGGYQTHMSIGLRKVPQGLTGDRINLFRVQSQVISPFQQDRKSTRLNSSHLVISYAVFCLKKKNIHRTTTVVITV